jgi:hypothetical protein
MSRLRSRINPRIVLALFMLVLSASLISLASTPVGTPVRTETGTAQQQAAVRTSREVSGLPLRSACSVIPEKELFVTDVSVVDDCLRTTWGSCLGSGTPPLPATQGAWTFGTRIASLAGTTNAAALSTFTLNWLHTWSTSQTINSDVVPARPNIQTLVINPWLAASGGTTLDMKKAPFRLLAIVSRLDLRENAGYSGGTSAGEGRFIYNVLDGSGNPTPFMVIFEYGLDAADCVAVQDWADQWHALGGHTFGPDYNAALQAVTDRFATIGASPSKPNGSAINQVRSDEIELVLPSPPWELREFKLAATSTTTGPLPLLPATVAQTPARSRQGTTAVSTYVNANAAAINANNYVVPLIWSGSPFRGGAAPNQQELGWDGPTPICTSITDPNARFNFSLNTCSGCHGKEAKTTAFTQISTRLPGHASTLAPFLTGESFTDMCGVARTLNDIDRRRVDLCQLLDKTCPQIDAEPVVSFVH